MCSSYKIGVDGLGVCLDLVFKLVERFEGGFATYGSDFILLEEGVLVMNCSVMVDDGVDQLSSYVVVSCIKSV